MTRRARERRGGGAWGAAKGAQKEPEKKKVLGFGGSLVKLVYR